MTRRKSLHDLTFSSLCEGRGRGRRRGGGGRLIVNARARANEDKCDVEVDETAKRRLRDVQKKKKNLHVFSSSSEQIQSTKAFLTIPVTGSVLRATSGHVLPQVSWN